MYRIIIPRQFSTNSKIKKHKINTSLDSLGFRTLGANKSGINPMIFHFTIRGKLSIIRCDKITISSLDIKHYRTQQ